QRQARLFERRRLGAQLIDLVDDRLGVTRRRARRAERVVEGVGALLDGRQRLLHRRLLRRQLVEFAGEPRQVGLGLVATFVQRVQPAAPGQRVRPPRRVVDGNVVVLQNKQGRAHEKNGG